MGWDGVIERHDGDLLSPPAENLIVSRPAEYFEVMSDSRVKCTLCPHDCILRDGERGKCHMRVNNEGALNTLTYGKLISTQLISPEPYILLGLFDSPFVRAGVYGCCFDCDFCSSLPESTDFKRPEDIVLLDYSPSGLVDYVKKKGSRHLWFGYFEPTVNFEYVRDTAKLAHANGIKVHVDTCGFVHREPLIDLLEYVDDVQIGLKGFTEDFYRTYCKGRLAPVLDAFRTVREKGVKLAAGLLFIPGINEDKDNARTILAWLKDNVGTDTALWVHGFYPSRFLRRLPPTSVEFMDWFIAEAARTGFPYVLVADGSRERMLPDSIACPSCGKTIIRRTGENRIERNIDDGRCSHCSTEIPLWS